MAFDSSGGASLDGEPPASASPQPTSSFHGPRPCIATCYEHRTAWSEPRSTAPPCFASRPRPSRPRAEHAASPLTSSSTTASLGPAFRSDPRRQPLGSDPAIPSSKTTASSKPGRLRSTGALSSAPARLRAWLAPRATTAAGGAFTPVSPPRCPLAQPPEAGSAGSRRARHRTRDFAAAGRLRTPISDPEGRRAGRFPSTSATRTAYEHDHEPSEPRSRLPAKRVQLALNWEETSEQGWGPARSPTAFPGRPESLPERPGSTAVPSMPEPHGPNRTFARRQPRFHEPGANRPCRAIWSLPHRHRQADTASLPDAPEGAARALLAARARESFSQARSARAPPVTGSLRHRMDGPTPPILPSRNWT
jgi:hypothetical protein